MLPYITGFILSDETREIHNNNGASKEMQIVNPRNIIRPPFLPATPSFTVSTGILNLALDEKHTLMFKIIDPNEQEIFSTNKIELPFHDSIDNQLPREAHGLNINLNLKDVPLRKSGKYTAQITIDENIAGNFGFYVYPMEQESNE
ncbi:DUF6941 family protein [Bacillus haynesii]|uniref:DUF6941 family protein n=1 Tax=Bacillus haynesii TaxID=1925021 RepID=UPI001F623CD9|nr:hypothetical protein [Bacillus haynesii]MCI4126963.1 hypothetical protein [Bacillus haynesii]